MRDDWVPEDEEAYSGYLQGLRTKRERRKSTEKGTNRKRHSLNPSEREKVLIKTNRRCHICGGAIDESWEADHVLAHSGGGIHAVDNYLPAHRMCNNYRWDYLSEEFQEILRLGVWLRTQIEKKSRAGQAAAPEFVKYEKQRIARRKKT